MPANLFVHADNTCREARNQHNMKFAAVLTGRHTFRSVQYNFFGVGHTHFIVDQRFSTVATSLSRRPILETPEDRIVAGVHGGLHKMMKVIGVGLVIYHRCLGGGGALSAFYTCVGKLACTNPPGVGVGALCTYTYMCESILR